MATKRKPAKTTTQTHVVTTSAGNVRITEPTGTTSRRASKPKITVLVGEAAPNPLGGFIGFLRERAVVGVAIAFVVATQMQAVVKTLIANFIDPAFYLLFGGQTLSKRTFTLSWHDRHANFGWGAVIYGLIDFLFVVAAVYIIIRIFHLDKLDKKKD